jgi:hypothetical protein
MEDLKPGLAIVAFGIVLALLMFFAGAGTP